ncbi:MAG: TIM-barrel domain-containing protein, partial [Acidimicrobiales bacterium]
PSPTQPDVHYRGGWTRSYDYYTYGSGPYSTGYSCPSNAANATDCQAYLESKHPGLLDQAGWRLLDDTQSAVWTHQGWVRPRALGGDVQDGYLFAYGHDYQGALKELDQLTGPAPLLPSYLFGVWYSRYYPYTTADYEQHLLPTFRKNRVPLDTLSVDTDWKAPKSWDGWEWNPALFPDPQAFLDWAKVHGIHVTLNVHSSISTSDPRLAKAGNIAGGTLASATCFSGPCKVWDWSKIPQAESNFALQQRFERQGTSFWWLDWCCDASTVSMPGLTPDNWINHLYAQEMVNKGQRGFVLSRLGASFQSPGQVYPAGPWSAHTSTIHFTGDTWGTWNTLADQATLSQAEASVGEPYVSDDIGSFLGPPPGGPKDTPALYDRWVQLGAFQPILRLHSSKGDRLPWEYPQPVQGITEKFLRLREALVPYTYTLAAQAHASGLPITRPLYLDYPNLAAAYQHSHEYLYGPDVLVAPVTTPGQVATRKVWFPPGRWVDYFTGATFTGPSTASLTVPLDRMPVFVKAGGIIPEQPYMDHVGAEPNAPTILKVYTGANGSYRLYSDAGQGLGYLHHDYTWTQIRHVQHGNGGQVLTIGPASGHYAGEPSQRRFQLQ